MDKQIYINSLEKLVEVLNSSIFSLDTDIVIALSRKGPRLLEYLRKEKGLKEFPVITEHSLPFLFDQISRESTKEYRIFIVDDAVYYGSTVLALKDEIESYIKMFALTNRVKIQGIYTCIKDKDSLDFGSIPVYAIQEIRPGYGHFFVKEMMKNLRSLGKSLEVEFPEITFTSTKEVDIDLFLSLLKEYFGEDKVYKIDDPLGIPSISVILSQPKSATFRKLRMFVKGNRVSVVAIAPELVNTNLKLLRFVGFGKDVAVNERWQDVVGLLNKVDEQFENHSANNRNLVRTGVVLLNYFSSIDTFLNFKDKVVDALLKVAGDLVDQHLDTLNLYYLVGNKALVESIAKAWNLVMQEEMYFTIPNAEREGEQSNHIVFESSRLSNQEAKTLSMTNMVQVINSVSLSEALSAMFFNQSMMIERASRYVEVNRQSRLLFGYTYQYLWKSLWDYADRLESKDINYARIHQWVDIQIDNGSIVPQYIINSDNLNWVRVLRTGENEDVLISHWGRWVIHVFKKMLITDEDKRIGKVLRKNLEGILTAVFLHFQDRIRNEEHKCTLQINKEDFTLWLGLQQRREGCMDEGDRAIQINLIDFLVSKNLLKNDNRQLTISPGVADKEFSLYTTLSEDLVADIDAYIQLIFKKIGNTSSVFYIYQNTINYFLRDLFSVKDIDEKVKYVSLKIEENLDKILDEKNGGVHDKEYLDDIISAYSNSLLQYEMPKAILLDPDSCIDSRLESSLWKIRQLFHLICLICLPFDLGLAKLEEYIQNMDKEELKKMQSGELEEYLLSDECQEHGTPFINETFVAHIKNYIKNVILH